MSYACAELVARCFAARTAAHLDHLDAHAVGVGEDQR